jgi:hypothetical protein
VKLRSICLLVSCPTARTSTSPATITTCSTCGRRVHFFVAGSGGKLRPITPGLRSLFAKSAHGFAVLEIQRDALEVAFVGVGGEELYQYSIK